MGALFVYGGLTGKSPLKILGSVIKGQAPATVTASSNLGTPSTSPGGTPGAVPSSSGNPGATNGCSGAQTAANRATGRLMATAYGWGAGAQWNALDVMIGSQESGWCNVAQNPGSTAFGIGQFLDTTWATVGYSKSSDPVTQIAAMLAYIKQRYGNPVAAEQFHLANNWYLYLALPDRGTDSVRCGRIQHC